ncbi:MAG: pyridoxamine 5'-phosphate oxidase family protein [Pseudomonadota bacterium]
MTQYMLDSGETASVYEQDLQRLNELIGDIDIAMLTTRDDEGTLRSRPMGTQSKGEFSGTLFFFTDINSHKTLEVEENRRVNVAYSNPGSHKYASLSGRASLTQDQDALAQHWTPALKIWFPQGLDSPNLALLSVEVEKAEFWDSYSKPATLLAMAKALITGQQAEMGEDKQLDLKRGTSVNAAH